MGIALADCAVANLEIKTDESATGQLEISEVQIDNAATIADLDGDFPAWFELRNRSSKPADIAAYTLTENRDKPAKWQLPHKILAPGEILLVFASGKTLPEGSTEIHAPFKLSKNDTGLYLFSGSTVMDQALYHTIADNNSWIRSGNGAFIPCLVPSPGTANPAVQLHLDFSLPAGIYSSKQYPTGLSITLAANQTIHFTTDGSEPTLSSPIYSGTPITVPVPAEGALPNATVIRAALENDGRLTPTETVSYILNADTDLAVISLSSAPESFWSDATGIFTEANLYAALENKAFMEYFDENGKLILSQNIGITAFGAYSRTFPIKSIALIARSSYGKNSFEYNFFNKRDHLGNTIDSFKSLVLRNSGNDWDMSMLRDAFMTGLLDGGDVSDGLNVDHQAYKPVVVYLNGQYWGFYTLREKVTEDYLYENWPEQADVPVDIIANYSSIVGDMTAYDSLIDYLNAHSLAGDAYYNVVAKQIDIGEFIDYQIFNIYVDNTDWPGNNIKWWRPKQSDGKWRWISFDTDFGFGLTDIWYGRTVGSYNTLAFALDPSKTDWPNPDYATFMLRKLMENPGFKSRFYHRFDQLLSGRFSGDRAVRRLNALASIAEDEITSRHLMRWKSEIYTWMTDGTIAERAAQWKANIEIMREFARARPAYLRTYYEGWNEPGVEPQRGTGNGLLGSYYPDTDGIHLAGAPSTRTDPQINFNWDNETGVPGLVRDGGENPFINFSARWTGRLESSFTGTIHLYLTGDDGIRLKINGTTLIGDEAWIGQGATTYTATMDMVAGQKYPIEVEYFQGTGGASVNLEWSYKLFRETIPQSQLYNP